MEFWLPWALAGDLAWYSRFPYAEFKAVVRLCLFFILYDRIPRQLDLWSASVITVKWAPLKKPEGLSNSKSCAMFNQCFLPVHYLPAERKFLSEVSLSASCCICQSLWPTSSLLLALATFPPVSIREISLFWACVWYLLLGRSRSSLWVQASTTGSAQDTPEWKKGGREAAGRVGGWNHKSCSSVPFQNEGLWPV